MLYPKPMPLENLLTFPILQFIFLHVSGDFERGA